MLSLESNCCEEINNEGEFFCDNVYFMQIN